MASHPSAWAWLGPENLQLAAGGGAACGGGFWIRLHLFHIWGLCPIGAIIVEGAVETGHGEKNTRDYEVSWRKTMA